MGKFHLHFLFVAFFLISCTTDKKLTSKKWFKGNLHTHSYWSDGDDFPEMIMDWYKKNDYQFVALTDHNTLAEGEKWKVISEDSLYQNALKNYVDKYGTDWVELKKDSLDKTLVKLKTYDEYKGLFEKEDEFLILQAIEISDYFDGKPLHLNASNVEENIKPQGGESLVEVLQNNIDAVLEQRESTGKPMIVHINHPNFHYAIGLEDMIALRNEQFFEVYNGHHMVRNQGDSMHLSTEKMWDLINIAYIEEGLPLMYGLATDDAHNYHRQGREWSNAGRGWIEVYADSLHANALIEALEAGDFYATTGVELESLSFENNQLTVHVKEESGIDYKISFIGCKKEGGDTQELLAVDGIKGSFELTDDISFVRCKITSSKLHENPIEELIYETAWTQPVMHEL